MDTRPKFVIILTVVAIFLGILVFSQVQRENSAGKSTSSPVVQSSGSANSPTNKPAMKQVEKPTMTIDQKKTYSAVLKTSVGDITIVLDAKAGEIPTAVR